MAQEARHNHPDTAVINAETVLARRTQRGLSQRQLAKHAGVSYMTISRMENGSDTSNLPLSVVGRLADALDLEPAELLRPSGRTSRSSPPSPLEPDTSDCLDDTSLHHDAACLLRKIQRGEDIRRTMGRVDREIILPSLVNSGLVTMSVSGAAVTSLVAVGLSSGSACTKEAVGDVPEATAQRCERVRQ